MGPGRFILCMAGGGSWAEADAWNSLKDIKNVWLRWLWLMRAVKAGGKGLERNGQNRTI